MIQIDSISETEWLVTVTAATRTEHRVRLTSSDLRRLAKPGSTATQLIEASFKFLLERESNTSILPSFNLPVIGTYFPEYEARIADYL